MDRLPRHLVENLQYPLSHHLMKLATLTLCGEGKRSCIAPIQGA